MSTNKTGGARRVLSAGFVFSALFLSGCDSSAQVNNSANKTNASSQQQQTKDKMIVIEQGTVGTVNRISVGVKNIRAASAADLAVWNSSMTQEKRNDYNVKFSVKAGDVIPIGDKFYRVGTIGDKSVEIHSEPVTGSAKLDVYSLAIPAGGNLELHGTVVEVVAVVAENGKAFATVEAYSNDYPKEESAKKAGGITKSSVAAGDMLEIGGFRHKIVAVHAAREGAPGIVEISVAPAR